MWTCENCGSKVAEEAAFCDSCGAPRPAEPGKATAGKRRKTPLLIGGIVLGLALIGLGLWLLLGKSGGEPLFRMTYSKGNEISGAVTETRYSYNGDAGRAEYYRNGYYDGYELLSLDDRGLIASAERYDADGVLTERRTYAYDKAGNISLQRNYRSDGSLYREYEIESDDAHVTTKYVTREYTDGQETSRIEFVMTDRTHGVVRLYHDGELDKTNEILRSFEGDLLVEQQTLQDGTVVQYQTWERDEYGNPLQTRIEYRNGPVQEFEYRYERIG